MAAPTVSDRVGQARHDLSLREAALVAGLVAGIGIALLALQEPALHDSLHNVRHSAGITCH